MYPVATSYIFSIQMGTMAVSLSRFKRHRSVPVVALVSAVLLVSGQVLTCCSINESLSETLAKAFRTLGIIHSHHADIASEHAPKAHPNCHGHASAGEEGASSDHAILIEAGQASYEAHEACISEFGFTIKAQPSNPLSLIDLPVQTPIGLIDDYVRTPAWTERPRPQNKSSPPVYLLTLRILV